MLPPPPRSTLTDTLFPYTTLLLSFHMPHAETAMRLRNEHTGEAHFGELRPEVAREARRVGAVAEAAQMRNRRLFGHEGRDAVLEHRLVVIVIERHNQKDRKSTRLNSSH